MSIIKRKKQNKFFIMSNHAAQQNLDSLSSIGLLAYIVSLPHDFKLYKTYLQKKFTRRSVDKSWEELLTKKYIAGFSCYVDRKKTYKYIASDEELTQEEFNEFVEETIEEIKTEEGFEPKNIQAIKGNQFTIEESVNEEEASDVQYVHQSDFSDVQNEQYNMYSTSSTVQDDQIQIHINKEIEQKQTNKEIYNVNKYNDSNFMDLSFQILNSLFNKYSEGLFNKNEWNYFSNQIINEMIENKVEATDLYAYIESIIKTIVMKRKKKLGISTENQIQTYNWLAN